MPRISIKVKTELVRQDLQNLFSEVPKIGKFKILNVLNRIRTRMRAQGKKRSAGEKVQWDSEKQRRAYFATNGFGAGIPYIRSNKYIMGWQEPKPLGNSGYTLINNATGKSGKPYGKYVGGLADGTGQSRINLGHFVLLRDATELEIAKLPKEIRDEIVLTARREGFKSA